VDQWDQTIKKGEIPPPRPTAARAAIFHAFVQQPHPECESEPWVGGDFSSSSIAGTAAAIADTPGLIGESRSRMGSARRL
jgi:hypothetical protein